MNYEDEDYVRYYTRDTVSWMALGWEGQTVLALMLHGKFDRSGVFDCDGHTPSQAVTLVTRVPSEVVDVGIKRLLESKTWVHRDGKLVWPKFLDAQNCRRSDRLRQRESREKRQKSALGQDVTPGDIGHTASHPSQDVTLSLAEQSRAEDPPTPLPEVTVIRQRDPLLDSLTGKSPKTRPDVLALFARWKSVFNQPEAKLDIGIWNTDADVLAECLDAHGAELCNMVCDFAPNDGMVSGRDDEKRQPHPTIAYIFGNQNSFLRILKAAKTAKKTEGITPMEKIRLAGERK